MTSAMPVAADFYFSTLADDADMAEIVGLFVAELPERLLLLAHAAEAGNYAAVGRLAHQLKGAGGSHGFEQITVPAAQLERAVRDGHPAEHIHSALDDLIAACSRVRAGLPN